MRKDILLIFLSYHKSKPEESETVYRSLFSNIKINSTYINILDYYNNIFIKKLETLINVNFEEEEIDEYIKNRKRKLSVPDNIIRKFQHKNESAFDANHKIYEPLSKTIFHNVTNFNNNLIRNCYSKQSPLLTRSYASPLVNLTHTPRTNKVRDMSSEYCYSDKLIFGQSSGSNNRYKEKLKSLLNSSNGKLKNTLCKYIKFNLLADISRRGSETLSQNELQIANSIPNSLESDDSILLTPQLSQKSVKNQTPEFNKTKK
jgi:hypothetical protein